MSFGEASCLSAGSGGEIGRANDIRERSANVESSGPRTKKRRLFGIRVAYNGAYLCTDENGIITSDNIVLRKNQFRRFGRWYLPTGSPWPFLTTLTLSYREWIEDYQKEERTRTRKRANLRMINMVNSERDERIREMERTFTASGGTAAGSVDFLPLPSTPSNSTASSPHSSSDNHHADFMGFGYRGIFRSVGGTGFLRDKRNAQLRASKKPPVGTSCFKSQLACL